MRDAGLAAVSFALYTGIPYLCAMLNMQPDLQTITHSRYHTLVPFFCLSYAAIMCRKNYSFKAILSIFLRIFLRKVR